MSYLTAPALQEAVFGRLSTDPALVALVGGAIFDTPPQGTPPSEYVLIGAEEARDRSDMTGRATLYRFTVSVVGSDCGFHRIKTIAAAVDAALTSNPPVLGVGHLAGLHFDRARVRRDRTGSARQVDLRFRALVDETA